MGRPSKYPPEFRERAVRMARESDRPVAAVARDLGVHYETLRIRRVRDESASVYGQLKVWDQLRDDGIDVVRCTVERLTPTTDRKGSSPVNNLLGPYS
jgi:transposase-like protein